MKEMAKKCECFKMIHNQTLEKCSEDLSSGAFGAWVNKLICSHPVSQIEDYMSQS